MIKEAKAKNNNNNLFYQDILYSCLYLYLHPLCHKPHRSEQPGVIQQWMQALGQETQGTGSETQLNHPYIRKLIMFELPLTI